MFAVKADNGKFVYMSSYRSIHVGKTVKSFDNRDAAIDHMDSILVEIARAISSYNKHNKDLTSKLKIDKITITNNTKKIAELSELPYKDVYKKIKKLEDSLAKAEFSHEHNKNMQMSLKTSLRRMIAIQKLDLSVVKIGE